MSLALNLDPRQRAMLHEMGVRVWQPLAPARSDVLATAPVAMPVAIHEPAQTKINTDTDTNARNAIDSIANNVRIASRSGQLPSRPVVPSQAPHEHHRVSWRMAPALTLYPQASTGHRWLILTELPTPELLSVPPEADGAVDAVHAVNSFEPFEGNSGKLLHYLLRAVRLHQTGTATLVPLVRYAHTQTPPDAAFFAALAATVQTTQPDVVLVMGRLAAQLVLQSSKPFGQLRGQVHTLHGVRTVVTYNAAYLLSQPLDKARAWDDLCLALSLLQPSGA